MSASTSSAPSAWAQRMGYGGLVPFVGLALAVWTADPAQRALGGQALLGYAATIASFLGAIHWGLAMREGSRQSPALLGWGVVPSLLAWLALMAAPVAGLLVLAGLLWVCFAVDRVVYPRLHVQAWLSMRWRLTLVASASCVAGAVGLLR
jgi:Protein of unknown function (DUF3429)